MTTLFSQFCPEESKEKISEDLFESRYSCQICCNVLQKDRAKLCSRCDYIYCQNCLDNIQRNNMFPACSSCRKPRLMDNLSNYPRFLINSLEDLVFKCKVCDQVLQTREMETHLKDVCKEMFVKCPYNPEHNIKMSQLTEHIRTCEESIVVCTVCFKKMKFGEAKDHQYLEGCL
jgi:hypothetical protein